MIVRLMKHQLGSLQEFLEWLLGISMNRVRGWVALLCL